MLLVDLIDNGDFREVRHPLGDPLPWWRQRVPEPASEGSLAFEQPVAAFGPLAPRVVIRGEVAGAAGVVAVSSGDGSQIKRVSTGLGAFSIPLADDDGQLGGPPRFTVMLEGTEATEWRSVAVDVPLPAPAPADLEGEVVAHLDRIHTRWIERALDDIGPRKTAYVTFDLDAVTGERAAEPYSRVSLHPLYTQMLEVVSLEPAEQANARRPAAIERERALVAYVEDLLNIGVHPGTGLPRAWDPVTDRGDDGRSLEIAIALRFLIDVAEKGPLALRPRALAAARRIGDTVLRHGVRPDETVAATYRPLDGQPTPVVAPLRQLDVPAELARLTALTGEARYADAARAAILTLEYLHYWPLAWGKIDPGFDDLYGHLGARAITMWRVLPQEAAFRRLAVSGLERYAPALADLVRHGGYVAADQIRCWRNFVDILELEPERAATVGPILWKAARQHFKGQQWGGGTWIDVTMEGWKPVTNLPVGDLGGMPQNLLQGLAVVSRQGSGLSEEQRVVTRAMFTAVMRTSDVAYGEPHGHVVALQRRTGFQSDEGSLRFAAGLVEMLRTLRAR